MKAKPGELKMQWARASRWEDHDICYAWGGGGATSSDASFLHWALGAKSGLVEELQKRGYDITTIKFSIQKKKD